MLRFRRLIDNWPSASVTLALVSMRPWGQGAQWSLPAALRSYRSQRGRLRPWWNQVGVGSSFQAGTGSGIVSTREIIPQALVCKAIEYFC